MPVQVRSSRLAESRQTSRQIDQEVDAATTERTTVSEATDWIDEIDAVLVENAEEFLRNYVQKSGQ